MQNFALPTWLWFKKRVNEFLEFEEMVEVWQLQSLILQVIALRPTERWELLDSAGFRRAGLGLDFLLPAALSIHYILHHQSKCHFLSRFSLASSYFFKPNCIVRMITQDFISTKKVVLIFSRLNNPGGQDNLSLIPNIFFFLACTVPSIKIH